MKNFINKYPLKLLGLKKKNDPHHLEPSFPQMFFSEEASKLR